MDLTDADLEQLPEVDRRAVDPPVPVETATWSKAGQLDWWVKSVSSGSVGYVVRTASSAGCPLLIFDVRVAPSPNTRNRVNDRRGLIHCGRCLQPALSLDRCQPYGSSSEGPCRTVSGRWEALRVDHGCACSASAR